MKRLFFTGIIYLAFRNYGGAQKALTLQESIDIAIKNNIEVAQRELVTDAAAIGQKQEERTCCRR